jgi:hypothetical protein
MSPRFVDGEVAVSPAESGSMHKPLVGILERPSPGGFLKYVVSLG